MCVWSCAQVKNRHAAEFFFSFVFRDLPFVICWFVVVGCVIVVGVVVLVVVVDE